MNSLAVKRNNSHVAFEGRYLVVTGQAFIFYEEFEEDFLQNVGPVFWSASVYWRHRERYPDDESAIPFPLNYMLVPTPG